MIGAMNYASRLALLYIFTGFMLLASVILRANDSPEVVDADLLSAPMAQVANSTITPTTTLPPGDQTTITTTLVTSSTITLEPFPTITLVFPELPDTATPTSLPATPTPDKGIPLSMLPSDNPPTSKSGIVIVVIASWLTLVIFAVFIARKASQTWTE